jgi:SAM-dependent methyltransferase
MKTVTKETFQRDVFSENEGDRFFERNKGGLADDSPVKRFVVGRIAHHLARTEIPRVLEIGCASGGNLAALNILHPIDGFGIEPSRNAVRVGKDSFPHFDLRVGTADRLSFDDACMDVIWFGFCFYLVDRPLLHRVVAEADRVLKDGGFIAIHDFDPDVPCVRPYSHFQGVKSYKMNYPGLFLADPAYSLVEKQSFTDNGIEWTSDAHQRLAFWICRKNVNLGYRQE